MTSAELQFDKMEVDTSLAKAYIEKHNNKFHNNNYAKDISQIEESTDTTLDQSININPNRLNKLRLLSNKIEENIDLFCQLEYLIRQVPPEITKMELQMIIACLRKSPESVQHGFRCLLMQDTTPLLELGLISLFENLNIVAHNKTAAVCHLFIELCLACGLIDSVTAGFMSDKNCTTPALHIKKDRALDGCCVAIVTEKSDLDSAIDVILAASTVPHWSVWRIRRVLVQESVYDRFKKALSWKAKPATDLDGKEHTNSPFSDSLLYDGTMYVYEFVPVDSDDYKVTLIEAFRTAKESISLVKEHSPFCVSLWSRDVCECYEMALKIAPPLVWVNEYCASEPTIVSRAYLSHVPLADVSRNCVYNEVSGLQKNWKSFTSVYRRQCLLRILNDFEGNDERFKAFYDSMATCESGTNNGVHVASNSLTMEFRVPQDVSLLKFDENSLDLSDFARRLVNGCGFLFCVPERFDCSISFISYLSKCEKVPVKMFHSETDSDCDLVPRDKIKVVQTAFGSMFAN